MAITLSGLAVTGTALFSMGAAAPTAAAMPAGTATQTVGAVPLTLSSSWCARHPWRCHGVRHHHGFRHHHDFRHHGRHGWGGHGGHGGWGGDRNVSIHNENINISSSGGGFGHRW
jgi:hypothetical protein